eukprot:scaffold22309_cov45-Prasinocladus_malaysianus.AAC.1
MKASSIQTVEEAKNLPQTFIPPHMMGSVDTAAFGFDITGASPAAILKKDKLRTRNAILRSTGFLANQQDYNAAQFSRVTGGNISYRQTDSPQSGFSPVLNGGLKAAMEARQ